MPTWGDYFEALAVTGPPTAIGLIIAWKLGMLDEIAEAIERWVRGER